MACVEKSWLTGMAMSTREVCTVLRVGEVAK